MENLEEKPQDTEKLNDAHKGSYQSKWSNPLLLTLLGGIGTALLAVFNNWWQFQRTIAVERTKLESSLILKAVESSDALERKNALSFLVDAGLIHDPENKIKNIKIDAVPQIFSAPTSANTASRWGIVFGGDKSPKAAQDEVAKAVKLGSVGIYLRQNSYRTVIIFDSRADADRMLPPALSIKTDAYLVNMSSWCPETIDRGAYKECIAP